MQSRVAPGDPSRPRPLLGALVVIAVTAMMVVGELASDIEGESEIGILLSILLFALIAGLMVMKRPNHPISWLLAIAALFGGVAGLSAEALPPGLTTLNAWQTVLALVSGASWYGLLAIVLVLIPLLFPTGSPPSPRWRWVGWLTVTAWTVMSLSWFFQETFCTDTRDDGCYASIQNPIGIPGVTNPEESVLGGLFFAALIVCSVAAVVSLVMRFRRSGRVEREQVKWVLLSLALFLMTTVLFDVIWVELLGQNEPTGPFFFWLDQILWLIIPLSVALAILRYRLYDIDRIISRTVSYVLVLALIGIVVLALVALMTLVVPSDDPIVVAVATLTAAALFNPLRRRLQRIVDRRFNRSRFDASRVAEEFAGSLRDRVDTDEVVSDWVRVVSDTMQPATIGVWMRPPSSRS